MGLSRLRAEQVLWRVLDGEVLVYDLAAQTFLSLNMSAALLLPLLQEGADDVRLAAVLVSSYGIAPAVAERDVVAFLQQLQDNGLVVGAV